MIVISTTYFVRPNSIATLFEGQLVGCKFLQNTSWKVLISDHYTTVHGDAFKPDYKKKIGSLSIRAIDRPHNHVRDRYIHWDLGGCDECGWVGIQGRLMSVHTWTQNYLLQRKLKVFFYLSCRPNTMQRSTSIGHWGKT